MHLSDAVDKRPLVEILLHRIPLFVGLFQFEICGKYSTQGKSESNKEYRMSSQQWQILIHSPEQMSQQNTRINVYRSPNQRQCMRRALQNRSLNKYTSTIVRQ